MAFTWNRTITASVVDPAGAAITASPLPDATEEQRKKLGPLLVDIYSYLKVNAPAHPALAPAIEAMHSAVAAYQSRQPGDPFAPIRNVLAVIEAQRSNDPSIPQP
jgi:hypothetical protein